ncbi:hypothetical protein VS883_27705, partial [Escherichia coli]
MATVNIGAGCLNGELIKSTTDYQATAISKIYNYDPALWSFMIRSATLDEMKPVHRPWGKQTSSFGHGQYWCGV